MVVDAEPKMSEAKMNDIIKAAIAKETKALRKELKKLRAEKHLNSRRRKDSLHPKGSRGQCQGALEKEKQSNNNRKKKETKGKKVRFTKQSDSVDANARGTKPKSILRNPALKNSSKKKSNSKSNRNPTGKNRQSRN